MIFDLSKPQCYWFNEISKIPHASRNEKQLSDFIVEFARKRGFYCKQDHVWNVLVEKEASEGYESSSPLILQAHIDMVPAKTADSRHDFSTEPLELYVDDEGWLHASGTTLGADDGHGVSYMLAILDDDSLPHPKLQCFFTVMEEIGLLGSMEIRKEDVKADRMINLDGGGETSTGLSAAGGYQVYIHNQPVWESNDRNSYRLSVSGLTGGHSGGQIHLEKGNALVIAARTIREAINHGADIHIASFTGGEKDNAIPRNAEIIFSSETDEDVLQSYVSETLKSLKTELEFSDGKVEVTLSRVNKVPSVMENGLKLIDFAWLMPNGFQHKSMVIENLTVTSLNLGVAVTDKDDQYVDILIRSAIDSASEELKDRLKLLADHLGLRFELIGKYSGWNYEPVSPLRESLRQILAEKGQQLSEHAGHGGNECGVFKSLNPRMDIITYGPICSGAHTPEEKMNLESFDRTYDNLRELIIRCK